MNIITAPPAAESISGHATAKQAPNDSPTRVGLGGEPDDAADIPEAMKEKATVHGSTRAPHFPSRSRTA